MYTYEFLPLAYNQPTAESLTEKVSKLERLNKRRREVCLFAHQLRKLLSIDMSKAMTMAWAQVL